MHARRASSGGASAAVVAAADCNGLTLGLEAGAYEGPLRVRIPVRLNTGVEAAPGSADGGWSFELPLPDPTSQKLLGRCTLPAATLRQFDGLGKACGRRQVA